MTRMAGDRLSSLSQAFEQAAAAFQQAVTDCPQPAWANVCSEEGWTVAALAHHVARGHARGAEWIATMSAGQPVSLTEEELNTENADDARRFAGCTKGEVVALHGRNSALLRALLRALSPEDLDRRAVFGPAGGAMLSVERIAGANSRHIAGHLASIQQAIGAGATTPPAG